MRWLGRETGKSKKTNKVSIPAWPASLKYIGTGWRVLKARSLWRCLPGRQPTEGHGERAWILPLGFAHSPLGPQNSNDFLFSLSNVGLLTRIMMNQIQRNVTRHKDKAKMYFKNFMDLLDCVCFVKCRFDFLPPFTLYLLRCERFWYLFLPFKYINCKMQCSW